jgi:hypothetical protein
MADKRDKDNKDSDKGFFKGVNKFFSRVQNKDLIQLGDKKINTLAAPATKEENQRRSEFSVFRQYLQQKNWSTRHIELFTEYRKMDETFPIINAALRLYAQEVCLSGDTIIRTPQGDETIKKLFEGRGGKGIFYVAAYNNKYRQVEWNMANFIKSNGIKKVYKVTVERNIDEETAETDKIQVASFKCTDNHKIMLNAQGDFKELSQLKVGDKIFSRFEWIDPECKCKKNTFNQTTITNIEDAGEEEVFDLVNVAPSHHFSIKLTDSFYVEVHNCTKDSDGNIIKIITSNKEVKAALEECFFKNLKINSQSYLLVKELLKFGNLYCFLNTRRGIGVTDLIHLPPETVRIQLMPDADTLDAFRYDWMGSGGAVSFEPWELVHWRNIEDIEMQPYGTSILRSIVDTWRRIVLMREALIIYRITRAPQRYLFKIDTTGMDPDAALKFAEEMKKQLYKKPMVNPTTGEIDFKYNPISVEENFYMPTFEGDVGGVDILQGASNLGDVEDYKIIKDDLFAGLLIPKSFLTFEEDLCLRGDTRILTNEGIILISELAEQFTREPDKKVFSLSCNKYGIITSGRILNCWETKRTTQLIRVHINNETYVDATPNHPFLNTKLIYIPAEELEVGEVLKGMYEKEFIVTNKEFIQLDIEEPVYDLEVEEHHNFALECGVFVHNSNKAALAQEDLRFSGAIKQYQSYFIEGLLHVALVHLHMNGFSTEDLGSFVIEMNTNSTLAEKTRNELLQQRVELAKAALDDSTGMSIMSYTQVLKDIMKFTNDQISRCFKDQLIEKKIVWRLNQLKEQGFYEEPEQEKKRAMMKSLNADEDIFGNLKFESVVNTDTVKTILSEKLDQELSNLIRPVSASPTRAMIEKVVGQSTYEKNEAEFYAKAKKKK